MKNGSKVAPRSFIVRSLVGSLIFAAISVHAAPAGTVRDAATQAIESNPDVQSAWHTFKAATYQVGEARSGYMPSVDLAASTGRNYRDFDGQGRYTNSQGQVSLTQSLFEGFRTLGQVEHLEGARLVRYYELLDSVETTAFEAVRAYEDVSRERQLLSSARDNYAKHQEVYAQIEERVASGVGRKVDLEQVAGRLALAETNLLTEASNLHDVTSRYLRIVGQLPAADLAASSLAQTNLPTNIREALQLAYQGNSGFHAAVKNIAAMQANVKVERSGYYPKAELRARQVVSRNTNGFDERVDAARYGDESAVELAITYNLFSGGATRSAVRRALEEVNQAKDLRDKACVDLRQNTQIAYNDSQRLKEQLKSLDQHRRSSDKVRIAYGEQFKIGQRSLLDLLDAENEYFQANRAYTSAQADLNIAHARTLAAMGKLLPALNITRESLVQVKDAKVNDKGEKIDGANACPAEVVEGFSRKDLVSEMIRISGDALFDVGSSALTTTASQKLELLVQQIKNTPNVVQIKIDGHTDNTGTDMINIPLSKARAESVKNYFILNGLDQINYQTEGYGATRAVGDNSTEQGKAANRRVEVTVSRQQ
ncbi:TolC family outer membrane protein [Cellvibrio sp.]|uniref:TolC family outer membrane protein n=1 Tax=Cellvibrio sp. TaxID=1965322 RepID=UPI00396477C8